MTLRAYWILAVLLCGCGPGVATSKNYSNFTPTNLFSNFFVNALQLPTVSSVLSITHPSITLSGNTTIEAWIRVDGTVSGSNGIIYQLQVATYFLPKLQISPGLGLVAIFANGVCSVSYTTSPPYILSTGIKYHVAATNNGGTAFLYVNGANVATIATPSMGCTATSTTIGNDGTFANGFPGVIDEVRVSNIIRYSTAFSVPTVPFLYDANTILLYHADNSSSSSGTFSSTEFPVGSTWSTTSASFITSPFP